jgi:hypothetical protein
MLHAFETALGKELKIQSGGNKKEYCLTTYNMEKTRKSIVLKNSIWRKQERILS